MSADGRTAGAAARRITLAALAGAALLAGCSDSPPPNDAITLASGSMQPLITPKPRPSGPQTTIGYQKPGLTPRACSDIEPTHGTLHGEVLLKAQWNEVTPEFSITTEDIAFTDDGSMYVLDRSADQVLHLDQQGGKLQQFGRRGEGPGEITTGRAIALGPKGNILAVDHRARVNLYSPDGKSLDSFRVQNFFNVSDLLVLPNGNIVLAQMVMLPMDRPYVGIFEAGTGELVRNVLAVTQGRANGERPLMLGANQTRLSAGPDGRFAVWYPTDNFVDVFDSTGVYVARIEGCLPDEIRDIYARQFTGDHGRGSYTAITYGVSFAGADTVRVVSRYMKPEGGAALRIRRYALDGTELSARDYDLVPRFNGSIDAVEFLDDSTFIAYSAHMPEQGITRYRIR